jgi:hypothetical protein
MAKGLEALRDVEAVQKSDGNWNYNSYMHGMANGLILALAIMEDRDPVYLDTPAEWLADRAAPSDASSSPVADFI